MFVMILFYAFSSVLIAAALGVITTRNPVHSALCLVLAFFTSAGIWLLIEAEFLAIVLVLVYVGAVMVLFLFVVMMLDINLDAMRAGFWRHFPLAAFIGVIVALEMAAVLLVGFDLAEAPAASAQAIELGNTKLLGIEMYTNYIYPLEVASVLLLVAIIAAIALTLRGRKDAKSQVPAEQILAKKADRLRIVSVEPAIEAPAAAARATGAQP